MRKLVLSHWSGDNGEVKDLAGELRLHGIVPWVDKDGGFHFGDNVPLIVRNALESDAFGLLLYATKPALDRMFIKRIEIDHAIRIKGDRPNFVLVAVARGIGFEEISAWALENFGFDLANFHAYSIPASAGELDLRSHFRQIAVLATERILRDWRDVILKSGALPLQFLTRGSAISSPSDLLVLDAAWLIEPAPWGWEGWDRVYNCLLDVRNSIIRELGIVPLRVHGYRHLTGAFILGRAFPRVSGFVIETEQNREYWSTACTPASHEPLEVHDEIVSPQSEKLFVELSTGDRSVTRAVRKHVQEGARPHAVLRMLPKAGLHPHAVKDNAMACAIAAQFRKEVLRAISNYSVTSIHLFAAVPHSVATMIGHHLNAMPPTYLYEYDGLNYNESYILP